MENRNLDNLVHVVLFVIDLCKSTTFHFNSFSFDLFTFFVVIALSSLGIFFIRKIFF